MANGTGVSVQPHSGRWRVMWRERVSVDGGAPTWKQRSRVVSTEAAAIVLRAEILRAIETAGHYDDPMESIATVTSVDALLAGFLVSRRARGAARSTLSTLATLAAQATRALRAHLRLRDDQPIPADRLTREAFVGMVNQLRDASLADGTVYGVSAFLLDAWNWGADDPEGYPGVATPPRDRKSVMPRAAVYVAPPAPTLAEIDAVLRALPYQARVAKGIAVVMRYTGLRVAQALALRRSDWNPTASTITIRTGKSAREKASPRTIPVPRSFALDVAPWLGDEPTGPLVMRDESGRRVTTGSGGGRLRIDATLTAAWQRATDAGEVRPEVWKPSNRDAARPNHAFRSAYQSALVRTRIAPDVISALVGHATLRERHYAGPEELMDAMREAVDNLPPIDWSRPATGAGQVIPLGHRR